MAVAQLPFLLDGLRLRTRALASSPGSGLLEVGAEKQTLVFCKSKKLPFQPFGAILFYLLVHTEVDTTNFFPMKIEKSFRSQNEDP